MPYSLEKRLASALEPTPAPADLWARVDAALPASPSHALALWPKTLLMAAALAVLMSGGVLYLRAQQTTTPSFASTALAWHRQQSPDSRLYSSDALERYVVDGNPITVVSRPVPASSTETKHIQTAQLGSFSISEWTLKGRQWALVSDSAHHRRACSVCHRA